MRTCSNPSKNKKPSKESFLVAGAEGFEPPEWLDQNQLPYHLATPQYSVFYLPDTKIIRNIYSIGHTVSCQELFKQPKLLCFGSGRFIYFIIKTAYVIIRYRIVSKILYPALSDGTELYILTETAYFPFFIHFVLVYHKEILQQNL